MLSFTFCLTPLLPLNHCKIKAFSREQSKYELIYSWLPPKETCFLQLVIPVWILILHLSEKKTTKTQTLYNLQEMHWHLFNLKLFWCVFMDLHMKEMLASYPDFKIGLGCSSSLMWLVTVIQWNVISLSGKRGSIFYHIYLCDHSPWIGHIYSKLYSITYLVNLSKIWLEFLI